MNQCLRDLFLNPVRRNRFARGLPTAFAMVKQRMPGNPAVGILREHVITGYLVAEFGQEKVQVPEKGNERSYDVVLCGEKLSIKTITGDVGFKILWTADTEKVYREIDTGYEPTHDILLINIFWDELKDSVFYIPLSAQQSVFNCIGRSNYLSSATGTNNRGIEIRKRAVKELKAHSNTFRMSVMWVPDHTKYPEPWDEWVKYWNTILNTTD